MRRKSPRDPRSGRGRPRTPLDSNRGLHSRPTRGARAGHPRRMRGVPAGYPRRVPGERRAGRKSKETGAFGSQGVADRMTDAPVTSRLCERGPYRTPELQSGHPDRDPAARTTADALESRASRRPPNASPHRSLWVAWEIGAPKPIDWLPKRGKIDLSTMKSRLPLPLAADPVVSWTPPIIMGFGVASRSAVAGGGASAPESGRGARRDRRLHMIRKSDSRSAKANSFPPENLRVTASDPGEQQE